MAARRARRRKDGDWYPAAALALLAVLAYLPALGAGQVWDDTHFLLQTNPSLRTGSGLWRIWFEPGSTPLQYYPVTFTTFWLQVKLFGDSLFAAHAINVLAHAANAVLLWLVLRRLQMPAAFFGAALFALHPVNVESVAWISQRKNVLAGMFALLTVLSYLRHRETGSRGAYGATVLAFVAALAAKTAVAPLPVALLILEWWRDPQRLPRSALRVAPLFVAALAFGQVTIWREELGLPRVELFHNPLERVLVAGRALWFYAAKLVLPWPSMPIHPRWAIDVHSAAAYAYPAGALAVLIGLWVARSRIGRGPFAAAAMFTVLLAPVLGFRDVGFFHFSWVAEHFLYFAAPAPLAAFAAWAARRTGGRGAARVAAAALLAVWGAGTAAGAWAYRDSVRLFSDNLKKNPGAWMAHFMVGTTLVDRGQMEEGLDHIRQALAARPEYDLLHLGLGIGLEKARRAEEALAAYRRAVEIEPRSAARARLARLANDLAVRRIREGRRGEARELLGMAVAAMPAFADAQFNLGQLLYGDGDVEEAIAHLSAATRADPTHWKAFYLLGNALGRSGRYEEAVEATRSALRMRPGFAPAHYDLGRFLLRLGHRAEARNELRQALRLKPDLAPARRLLEELGEG